MKVCAPSECGYLDACSAKMYNQLTQTRQKNPLFEVNSVPGSGAIDSFSTALSALNYLAAAIEMISSSVNAAASSLKAPFLTLRLSARNP